MGSFGQGIGLVHELAQLARTEEFLHNGRHRLWIDKIVRHQGIHLLETHPLLDRPLHANQTDSVLVFQKFANRAHTPISQMVDVVHHPLACPARSQEFWR